MSESDGPVIVPLTHEHLAEWYGDEGRKPSINGIAGFIGGKLVAVAGLFYMPGNVVAFCELKEEARAHRLLIALTAARLLNKAKQRHKRIIAMVDRAEPTAERWLSRLGFEQESGDMWIWRTSV